MNNALQKGDKIRWKTKNTGFATGKVTDILDGKVIVEKTSYTSPGKGAHAPNRYTIQLDSIREINGEEVSWGTNGQEADSAGEASSPVS